FAPGPMVTWYCVFGARSPAVGVTESVFSCHEKATVVAGVICTAASVDLCSIGWLKVTWIGCCRRTALWFEIELEMTTWSDGPGWLVAGSTTTAPMRITPTAAVAQTMPVGPNTLRHHGVPPPPM